MASVTATINVNVNAKAAMGQLAALQKQMVGLNKGFLTSTYRNVDPYKKALGGIADTLAMKGYATSQTGQMMTTLGRLHKEFDRGTASIGEYRKNSRHIDAMAADRVRIMQSQYHALGREVRGMQQVMSITPTAPIKQLGADMMMAQQRAVLMRRNMEMLSTGMINWGKNTQWAGRQMMVGMGIPMGIAAAGAIKSFNEIEQASISFRRVYGDSATSVAEKSQMLEKVHQNVAREFTKYGIAVGDTLDVAAKAAATGAQGDDLVAATTETMRLATLGQMDYQTALESTIAMQTAFGIKAEDMGRKTDFLNAVENQTILSMEDMSTAVPRVATVIKGLGGGVEELAVMMTALRVGGVTAEQGANALKSGLASLINPTSNATKTLGDFGININKMVKGNEGDLIGLVKDMGSALDELGSTDRQRALEAMFGKYQYARMGALFKNIDNKQVKETIRLANEADSVLAKMSEQELAQISDSPMIKLRKAIEDLKDAAAPLGGVLSEIFASILSKIEPIVRFFGENKIATWALVAGAALTGLVGVVTMVTGVFANFIGTMMKLGQRTRDIGRWLRGKQSLRYTATDELEAATAAKQLDAASRAAAMGLKAQAAAARELSAALSQLSALQRSLAGGMGPKGPGGRPGGPGGVPILGPGGQPIAPAGTGRPRPTVPVRIGAGGVTGPNMLPVQMPVKGGTGKTSAAAMLPVLGANGRPVAAVPAGNVPAAPAPGRTSGAVGLGGYAVPQGMELTPGTGKKLMEFGHFYEGGGSHVTGVDQAAVGRVKGLESIPVNERLGYLQRNAYARGGVFQSARFNNYLSRGNADPMVVRDMMAADLQAFKGQQVLGSMITQVSTSDFDRLIQDQALRTRMADAYHQSVGAEIGAAQAAGKGFSVNEAGAVQARGTQAAWWAGGAQLAQYFNDPDMMRAVQTGDQAAFNAAAERQFNKFNQFRDPNKRGNRLSANNETPGAKWAIDRGRKALVRLGTPDIAPMLLPASEAFKAGGAMPAPQPVAPAAGGRPTPTIYPSQGKPVTPATRFNAAGRNLNRGVQTGDRLRIESDKLRRKALKYLASGKKYSGVVATKMTANAIRLGLIGEGQSINDLRPREQKAIYELGRETDKKAAADYKAAKEAKKQAGKERAAQIAKRRAAEAEAKATGKGIVPKGMPKAKRYTPTTGFEYTPLQTTAGGVPIISDRRQDVEQPKPQNRAERRGTAGSRTSQAQRETSAANKKALAEKMRMRTQPVAQTAIEPEPTGREATKLTARQRFGRFGASALLAGQLYRPAATERLRGIGGAIGSGFGAVGRGFGALGRGVGAGVVGAPGAISGMRERYQGSRFGMGMQRLGGVGGIGMGAGGLAVTAGMAGSMMGMNEKASNALMMGGSAAMMLPMITPMLGAIMNPVGIAAAGLAAAMGGAAITMKIAQNNQKRANTAVTDLVTGYKATTDTVEAYADEVGKESRSSRIRRNRLEDITDQEVKAKEFAAKEEQVRSGSLSGVFGQAQTAMDKAGAGSAINTIAGQMATLYSEGLIGKKGAVSKGAIIGQMIGLDKEQTIELTAVIKKLTAPDKPLEVDAKIKNLQFDDIQTVIDSIGDTGKWGVDQVETAGQAIAAVADQNNMSVNDMYDEVNRRYSTDKDRGAASRGIDEYIRESVDKAAIGSEEKKNVLTALDSKGYGSTVAQGLLSKAGQRMGTAEGRNFQARSEFFSANEWDIERGSKQFGLGVKRGQVTGAELAQVGSQENQAKLFAALGKATDKQQDAILNSLGGKQGKKVASLFEGMDVGTAEGQKQLSNLGKTMKEVQGLSQKGQNKFMKSLKADPKMLADYDKIKSKIKEIGNETEKTGNKAKNSGKKQKDGAEEGAEGAKKASKAVKDADKNLQKMGKRKVRLQLKIDEAKSQLEKLKNQIKKLQENKDKIKIRMDAEAVLDKIEKVKNRVKKLSGETGKPKAILRDEAFNQKYESIVRKVGELNQLSASIPVTVTVSVKEADAFGGEVGRAAKATETWGRVWQAARAFASGGHTGSGKVRGPGGPTADKVPALLSNGEYVIRASSVDKYGTAVLGKINRGEAQVDSVMKFAAGGSIGGWQYGKAERHKDAKKNATQEAQDFIREQSNMLRVVGDLWQKMTKKAGWSIEEIMALIDTNNPELMKRAAKGDKEVKKAIANQVRVNKRMEKFNDILGKIQAAAQAVKDALEDVSTQLRDFKTARQTENRLFKPLKKPTKEEYNKGGPKFTKGERAQLKAARKEYREDVRERRTFFSKKPKTINKALKLNSPEDRKLFRNTFDEMSPEEMTVMNDMTPKQRRRYMRGRMRLKKRTGREEINTSLETAEIEKSAPGVIGARTGATSQQIEAASGILGMSAGEMSVALQNGTLTLAKFNEAVNLAAEQTRTTFLALQSWEQVDIAASIEDAYISRVAQSEQAQANLDFNTKMGMSVGQAEAANQLGQTQITAYEHQIEEQNREYEKQSKLLDKIAQSRQQASQIEQGRTSVAAALSKGDVSSALAAAQQLQETQSQLSFDQMRQRLAEAHEAKIEKINEEILVIKDEIYKREQALAELQAQAAVDAAAITKDAELRRDALLASVDAQQALNERQAAYIEQTGSNAPAVGVVAGQTPPTTGTAVAAPPPPPPPPAPPTPPQEDNKGGKKPKKKNETVWNDFKKQFQIAHYSVAELLDKQWRGGKGLGKQSRKELFQAMSDNRQTKLVDALRWANGLTTPTPKQLEKFKSKLPKMATGGWIPGTGNRDSYHAMLMPGEFIMNKKSAARFGPLLEAMNYGRLDKSGSATTNISGDKTIQIIINGAGQNPEALADVVIRKLRTVDDYSVRGINA